MKRKVPAIGKRIRIKRVYEPASSTDGTRILVDRLWPRGVTKADAAAARWLKDVAPSPALRQWFHRDVGRWETFRDRYRRELQSKQALLDELLGVARAGPLTLVYAAREPLHNHAAVLRDVLIRKATRSSGAAPGRS